MPNGTPMPAPILKARLLDDGAGLGTVVEWIGGVDVVERVGWNILDIDGNDESAAVLDMGNFLNGLDLVDMAVDVFWGKEDSDNTIDLVWVTWAVTVVCETVAPTFVTSAFAPRGKRLLESLQQSWSFGSLLQHQPSPAQSYIGTPKPRFSKNVISKLHVEWFRMAYQICRTEDRNQTPR